MNVYVTVETCQGIVSDARVFRRAASARKAEQAWLKETGIKDKDDREAKSGNGTEFLVFQTKIEP